MIAYDDTEYLGKNKDYINMRFEDAVQKFTMPYNDVTVTVTWGPVSEHERHQDCRSLPPANAV